MTFCFHVDIDCGNVDFVYGVLGKLDVVALLITDPPPTSFIKKKKLYYM